MWFVCSWSFWWNQLVGDFRSISKKSRRCVGPEYIADQLYRYLGSQFILTCKQRPGRCLDFKHRWVCFIEGLALPICFMQINALHALTRLLIVVFFFWFDKLGVIAPSWEGYILMDPGIWKRAPVRLPVPALIVYLYRLSPPFNVRLQHHRRPKVGPGPPDCPLIDSFDYWCATTV